MLLWCKNKAHYKSSFINPSIRKCKRAKRLAPVRGSVPLHLSSYQYMLQADLFEPDLNGWPSVSQARPPQTDLLAAIRTRESCVSQFGTLTCDNQGKKQDFFFIICYLEDIFPAWLLLSPLDNSSTQLNHISLTSCFLNTEKGKKKESVFVF